MTITLQDLQVLNEKATQGEWRAAYWHAHKKADAPRAENSGMRMNDDNGSEIASIAPRWTDTGIPFWADGSGPNKKEFNYEEHEANAAFIAALVNFHRSGGRELAEDGMRWRASQSKQVARHSHGNLYHEPEAIAKPIDAARAKEGKP